jgi:hypothetical protein
VVSLLRALVGAGRHLRLACSGTLSKALRCFGP